MSHPHPDYSRFPDLLPYLERLTPQPCARLIPQPIADDDLRPGDSHFLGSPWLPPDFEIPTTLGVGRGYRCDDDPVPGTRYPLAHIVSLDLRSIHAAVPEIGLPSSGRLSFFYDLVEKPWGFDPAHRAGFFLAYFPEGTPLVRTPIPAVPHGLRGHYRTCRLDVRRVLSLPDSEQAGLFETWCNSEDTNHLHDEYAALLRALGGHPNDGDQRPAQHQVGGYAQLLQGDPRDEVLLAEGGVDVGSTVRPEDRELAARLRSGPNDFRLLFQLDTDESELGPNWMWDDGGSLYVYIRDSELRAARFDRAWTVLQSY